MITLFECWNGGSVQWDRMKPPQFVFNFPPGSPEVITFFQLSGRMCEVMTQTEWHLNMAGQLFDIPNFPPLEIDAFASNLRNTMGYAPVSIPYQIGNQFTGFMTIPIVLWVNVVTGRADMYNPFTGLVYGQQLLPSQQQFNIPVPTTNFLMSITPQGTVQGNGAKNFLDSLSTIIGGAGKIAELLSKTSLFQDGSQSF
ncbi:MAG: hypothetical protein FDX18_07140 [Chlorobium sp.]|nr:MAG: hypothetical protein FDX18_07140 [Chlorobium sp.]